MKYTVIYSTDLVHFIQLINIQLKDGWRPQGGICVTSHYGYMQYAQSLVKDI